MMYRIFIVLVFIAIVTASVLLGGVQREAVSPTTIDEKAGDLGYAARKARIIETGTDGRPLYTIDADLINEPPKSTTILAQQVTVGMRDSAGNEWTSRAEHGELGQDTGQIELSGNVRVSGVLSGIDEQANMATEKLLVDTRAQTITTDQPVTLTLSGHEIKAKGLAANLKDGLVHLESNVHGTYSQ